MTSALFITHESTRSGAPIMLLHLLRWLKEHTPLELEVLNLRSGPLDAEFASVAALTVLDVGATRMAMRLDPPAHRLADAHGSFRAVARTVGSAKDRAIRRRLAYAANFDVIYANSAVSAWAFDLLPVDHPPIITHVHELGYGLRYGIPDHARAGMVRHTDRYIAASRCVADALHEHLSVAPERIAVHHECIDIARYQQHATDVGPSVRQELGIPADALVVGASGTREWRKANDLFLLLAARLQRAHDGPPLYCVWVGGSSEPGPAGELRHDLERLGIEDRVRFVDETAAPERYFSMFDVFALTSREDPFALVCLEAALWGIPIVSFDSGGAAELIEDGDIGRVVPYADVEAMAATILEWATNDQLRHALGRAAKEKVARYDVSVVGPGIAAEIDAAVFSCRDR